MNKEIKEEGALSYLLRTLKSEQIEAMKMCMEYELQQEREGIIEEIGKKRKSLTVFQNPKSTKQEREGVNKLGYNQAIEDIIKTLNQ